MKEFSEYEKKILSKLIEIEETPGGLNVLGNIIDFELYPNFYIELKSDTNCPVRIAKSFIDQTSSEYGSLGINEVIKQLNNKLLYIVKLFQYLEREGQIYLTGEVDLSTLGSTFDQSETPVGYELDDKETVSLIYHIARKRIVPVDSLVKFVKNEFKTDAEIKAEKEQKITSRKLNWTAIGVIATIAGLVFSNVMEIVKLNNQDPNKIEIVNDDLQFKVENDSLTIKVEIEKFNDHLTLDTLPIDTLIVRQIKK